METVIEVLNKNTGDIWNLSDVEFRATHVNKNQILTHDQKMELQESEGMLSISPEEAKELERILEEINNTGDAI